MSDLVGQSVGRYRILEQLGLGGMATVYKGYDPTMDRYVAIKIPREDLTRDPTFRARFAQEARTLARLEHPHILPVHDFGEDNGRFYLVMRFVDGSTLRDLMLKGPLPLDQADRLIGEVADALAYAHGNKVVHRDIKPGNVLVDKDGSALLTDFGIAKLLEGTLELTGTREALGTPFYMSPEQVRGQPIDGRTDIYSLGVVLYEAMTGRRPFVAETPLAVALMHVTDPLPLPRLINSSIPERVERIILQALAKDPSHRFQSAADFAAALRARSIDPAGPSATEVTRIAPLAVEPVPITPVASNLPPSSVASADLALLRAAAPSDLASLAAVPSAPTTVASASVVKAGVAPAPVTGAPAGATPAISGPIAPTSAEETSRTFALAEPAPSARAPTATPPPAVEQIAKHAPTEGLAEPRPRTTRSPIAYLAVGAAVVVITAVAVMFGRGLAAAPAAPPTSSPVVVTPGANVAAANLARPTTAPTSAPASLATVAGAPTVDLAAMAGTSIPSSATVASNSTPTAAVTAAPSLATATLAPPSPTSAPLSPTVAAQAAYVLAPTPPPRLPGTATSAETTSPTPGICSGDEAMTFSPASPIVGQQFTIAVTATQNDQNVKLSGSDNPQGPTTRTNSGKFEWDWQVTSTTAGQLKYSFFAQTSTLCTTNVVTVQSPTATSTAKPTTSPTATPTVKPTNTSTPANTSIPTTSTPAPTSRPPYIVAGPFPVFFLPTATPT